MTERDFPQELDELMEYSAKFDIRPRRRFIFTSLFLGLFTFMLSCIAEEEKYSKCVVTKPSLVVPFSREGGPRALTIAFGLPQNLRPGRARLDSDPPPPPSILPVTAKSQHLSFCQGRKDSSPAGILGVVAMVTLIAAYVSCIAGTNECCNIVFCLQIGARKFNAGFYLCAAHLFFIISIIMLSFASMRELNSDCPTNVVSEAEFKILKDGYFASGGVLGFVAVIFSMLYYLDSLTLAGFMGEQGLLSVKKKTLGGTITSSAVALKKTTAGESGEAEMVSINVSD